MSERGKFIAVCGQDGSGKTIQVSLMVQRLNNSGIKTIGTEEHWRQDVLGKALEAVVELKQETLDPLAIQLTFIANRVNHTTQLIKPMLGSGKCVVTDRYLDSTLAYASDEDREFLTQMTERLVRKGKILRPDLTILVDVPVDVAMERLARRKQDMGNTKISMESIFEKKPKLEKVRNNFLRLFDGNVSDRVIIDGTGAIEQVRYRIMEEVLSRKIFG